MTGVLKRAWIPLLIVVVVVIGGFVVMRVKTFFGAPDPASQSSKPAEDTKPFNPKVVKYEIFGNGTYADINYLDLDSQPVRVDHAPLPWSLTLSTTDPSVFPNIVAQGDSTDINCRITVDDEVKDTNSSTGVTAQTFCLVKSA
ncbi:MAG: MmpS family transport accessory protein [Mycobacterium sp.]